MRECSVWKKQAETILCILSCDLPIKISAKSRAHMVCKGCVKYHRNHLCISMQKKGHGLSGYSCGLSVKARRGGTKAVYSGQCHPSVGMRREILLQWKVRPAGQNGLSCCAAQ